MIDPVAGRDIVPPPLAPITQSREPVVLCVDDDDVILELLFEILTVNGFRVICECDALRAIRTIASADIDAVIVDYKMPGCDGIELAKSIRRARPQLPVLMFSGSIVPEEELKSVSAFVYKNQGVLALIDALHASWNSAPSTR